MRHNSPLYIVAFSGLVCVVCSLLVSSAATLLKDRQIENAQLDKQRNVLVVSGLVEAGTRPDREAVQALFENRIKVRFVNLSTGEVAPDGELDPATYDQRRALRDPNKSRAVEANAAGVSRIPLYAAVYEIYTEDGQLERYVFPVEGKGLWSTLYGFVALDKDRTTIRGLTFYSDGETPGLGGEINNPRWKEKWPGRRIFDENWEPKIRVIKGHAGAPEEAPYEVDGLSGATITSNGVTNLLRFWFSGNGFGPFLERLRAEGSEV